LLKPFLKRTLGINTLAHLSHRLGFPVDELQRVASQAEDQYIFRKVPKKNGGFRTISNPRYRLKQIQESIHNLLKEVALQDSAHGGVRSRSNVSNARPHCKQRCLLNLDLKNFFPSISHYKVYELFHRKLTCSPAVAQLLTKLTTVNRQVPQGGPMSTDLANLVMRKTDERLEGLSRKYGINYTRFVDDMSFSGNTIPNAFISVAKEIISQSGFHLNPDKESMKTTGEAKQVTGLSVNRAKPNVPRKKRREVRKEAHIFEKYEKEQLGEFACNKKEQQIRGKLAYVNYVNSNRKADAADLRLRSRRKYGKATPATSTSRLGIGSEAPAKALAC
jgi:RNA-directed DNA polymerase